MSCPHHRITPVTTALLLFLALATTAAAGEPPAWAKPVKSASVKELGGPNRFNAQPISSAEELQAFFTAQRADIERALTLAGWPGDPEDLFKAVRDGAFEEAIFPVGGQLQWMVLRRGGRTVDVVNHVRWDGKKPFPTYLIRFESADAKWAFVVPKPCGNLSLFSRRGTGELTLTLLSGTATLTDPEGNPIVINAGESGTVSASWAGRPYSDESGSSQTPTSVQVNEGVVEFKEYGRPISVLVADGNQMSAVLAADGSMSLTVPQSNQQPMPIKVGDAVGFVSAGAGMAVDWTPPECRLRVAEQPQCLPGELVLDAGASTVVGGSVRSAELKALLGDGDTVELGAADGDLRWRRSFDQPGSYRFQAVAVSDKGRRSQNSCEVVVELPRCVPPPPTCAITVDSTRVDAFDTIRFDASASRSDGGQVEAVVVAVTTEGGHNRGVVEVEAPFTGELELQRAGAYILHAVAVDDFGQSSTNGCEARVEVRPRTGYSIWGFAGYGRRVPSETDVVDDGWVLGGKASVDRQVSRQIEISLGAGIDFDSSTDDVELFTDLTLDWLRDWGFFGGGFGVWDVTHSESAGSNLLAHGGWNLPWQVGDEPVQGYGELRLFLDELGSANDNFVLLIGVRMRP